MIFDSKTFDPFDDKVRAWLGEAPPKVSVEAAALALWGDRRPGAGRRLEIIKALNRAGYVLREDRWVRREPVA